MRCKNYFLVLNLSFFLTACASSQWNPSEVNEIFVTDIKSSGLKIFTYSLTKNTPQASSGSKNSNRGKGSDSHGGRGGKGGGMGGGSGESNMKQYFNEMLESKLKSSGYCREGYIELNSYFGRGKLEMRGECEEGATEEDRMLFVNNS